MFGSVKGMDMSGPSLRVWVAIDVTMPLCRVVKVFVDDAVKPFCYNMSASRTSASDMVGVLMWSGNVWLLSPLHLGGTSLENGSGLQEPVVVGYLLSRRLTALRSQLHLLRK